jgi:hypothetical protein
LALDPSRLAGAGPEVVVDASLSGLLPLGHDHFDAIGTEMDDAQRGCILIFATFSHGYRDLVRSLRQIFFVWIIFLLFFKVVLSKLFQLFKAISHLS